MATSQTDDASQGAAQAAYDRALLSSWPPTKEDAEAIGAAAGAAAGAVFGGGVGAIIGGTVGGFVGGVVYDIVNSIPSAADNPAARFMVYHRAYVTDVVSPTMKQLQTMCGISEEGLRERLRKWGWEIGILSDPQAAARRDANDALRVLEENKKLFFRAVSAVAAECQTQKQGSSGKNSAAAIVVLGVASAIGVGLIQKFVTRGKF